MKRLPPLNAVRTFEAAGRHLSFNAAADELAITPSAVSHQIRALEEHLGIKLFSRERRQVRLTEEGQAFLPDVRAGLERIAEATERVTSGAEGPLTMSLAPSFAVRWLMPRLPGFQAAYPEIEVRMISVVDSVDFTVSDVDVAVRFGLGGWPGLTAHRLLSEELVPVCSPALLKGEAKLERPQDLAAFTLLHASSRMGEWRMWLSAAGVTGIDPERGPKFHNVALALTAAESAMGVAIADRGMLAGDIEAGRLVAPIDFELPSESAYYLVYPVANGDRPKIAAFRDWLLEEVRRDPALVEEPG